MIFEMYKRFGTEGWEMIQATCKFIEAPNFFGVAGYVGIPLAITSERAYGTAHHDSY